MADMTLMIGRFIGPRCQADQCFHNIKVFNFDRNHFDRKFYSSRLRLTKANQNAKMMSTSRYKWSC